MCCARIKEMWMEYLCVPPFFPALINIRAALLHNLCLRHDYIRMFAAADGSYASYVGWKIPFWSGDQKPFLYDSLLQYYSCYDVPAFKHRPEIVIFFLQALPINPTSSLITLRINPLLYSAIYVLDTTLFPSFHFGQAGSIHDTICLHYLCNSGTHIVSVPLTQKIQLSPLWVCFWWGQYG